MPEESPAEAVQKKSRKRPGRPRSSKEKREKRQKTRTRPERNTSTEKSGHSGKHKRKPTAEEGATGKPDKKFKETKEDGQANAERQNKTTGKTDSKPDDAKGNGLNDLENRVHVAGLPESTEERNIRKVFGKCGKLVGVRLILNTRLIFKGSAFVSFADEDGVTAALALDGCDFKENTIAVKKALPPATDTCLKVYVGGLPYEADENTLRKDFSECGKIEKLRMLKDKESGSFRGVVFISYAEEAGVTAALEYDNTEYGGRTIKVNLANKANRRAQ